MRFGERYIKWSQSIFRHYSFPILLMEGAGNLPNNSRKALRAPSRVIRQQVLYPYPTEDPESPIAYVLESKRSRSLNIPLKPQIPLKYFWAPGKQLSDQVSTYFRPRSITLSLELSTSSRSSCVSCRYTSLKFCSIALW